jgi:hypothetical protein
MRTKAGRALLALVLAAAPALSGCPNAGSYSTPRTVTPGKFTHSFSVEGFGAVGTTRTADPRGGATRTESVSEFLPTFPSYELRRGVASRFDIGIHLYNLTSFGLDLKLNPIRGVFDIAVNPGAQYFYLNINDDQAAHVFYLSAPLMVGINLTQWMSIILTPGLTYSLIAGEVTAAEGRDALIAEGGTLFRAGFGLQFRASQSFAVHPMLTILRSLGSGATLYSAGIGFIFGEIPSYDDLDMQNGPRIEQTNLRRLEYPPPHRGHRPQSALADPRGSAPDAGPRREAP